MSSSNNTLFKLEIENPVVVDGGEPLRPQEIEVELLPPVDLSDPRKVEIYNEISEIDQRMAIISESIDKLNSEIDSLTNHADGLDYAVAVASGIIAGLLDSFLVGETDIDVDKIQKELEEKYHTVHDDKYKHKLSPDNKIAPGKNVSSSMYHRLQDLAHHPTPLGLVASILARYFRLVIFVDGTDGKHHVFIAEQSENPKTRKLEKEQLIKAWVGAIIGGLFLWLADIAENQYEKAYSEEMPEGLRKIVKALGAAPMVIEVLKAADSWLGHIMSDVSTKQGIPGVILSLLEELVTLPIIRDTGLPELIKEIYKGGDLNLSKYDGVAFKSVKKQAMPVLINETLVRGFYFVRRLIEEYKASQSFKEIKWENTLPFGNRTVERMMTIASGTFVAVDVADAAIRSGGFNPGCILRINFVGIGRFAVAIVTDVSMGVKKAKKENQRINLTNEQLHLMNAKIFYQQAGVWIEAEKACKSITEVYEMIVPCVQFTVESWADIHNNMEKIHQALEKKREEEALLEAFLKMLSDN